MNNIQKKSCLIIGLIITISTFITVIIVTDISDDTFLIVFGLTGLNLIIASQSNMGVQECSKPNQVN